MRLGWVVYNKFLLGSDNSHKNGKTQGEKDDTYNIMICQVYLVNSGYNNSSISYTYYSIPITSQSLVLWIYLIENINGVVVSNNVT